MGGVSSHAGDESGKGIFPEVAEYKVIAFDMLLISSSRTLSLAEPV